MATTSSGGWPEHLHLFMETDDQRDTPLPVISLQVEMFVGMEHIRPALQAVSDIASRWDGWSTWSVRTTFEHAGVGATHPCDASVRVRGRWLGSAKYRMLVGMAKEAVQKHTGVMSLSCRPNWPTMPR